MLNVTPLLFIYSILAEWPLVLENPGNQNSPGKLSWKSEKLRKCPGKVLELLFHHQQILKFSPQGRQTLFC